MATIRTSQLRDLFPLNSTDDVCRLFQQHLATAADQPDLTLLSIVTGLIENTLTSRCAASIPHAEADGGSTASAAAAPLSPPASDTQAAIPAAGDSTFPTVRLADVTALYDKFESILSLVEPVPAEFATTTSSSGGHSHTNTNNGTTRRQQQQQLAATPTTTAPMRKYATRELIKRVSDIVWNSLIRSTYKDRAHLQSLYSYLAAGKLDCFGMALTVVAGCQRLGYADVRLAISEDHAWVVFGPNGTDTIEVTWHGKGTEDKRGQPATTGELN